MSMWTSITGAIRSVAGIAAPIVGGVLAGPAGAAFGSAVGGALAPRPTVASLMGGPAPAPPVVGPGAGGTMPTAGVIPRVIGAGAQMFGRLWISARGIARTAAGKIAGVMKGTQLLRNKQVISLTKQIGIVAAAAALGITANDVAEMILAETGKRRRVRGISGRDIKCTRRTLGKLRSVQRLIGAAAPRGRARARAPVSVRCD